VAYDFVVRPGADLRRILLAWQGVDSLTVDARGHLLLHTAGGVVRPQNPVGYQDVNGARREVASRFVRKGPHQVGFEVAAYDGERPLAITGSVPFSIGS
jgi:hypothetical protein